jgi:hypothetical protein
MAQELVLVTGMGHLHEDVVLLSSLPLRLNCLRNLRKDRKAALDHRLRSRETDAKVIWNVHDTSRHDEHIPIR